MSLSHNKMLKEAMDHVQRENQLLKEQVGEQQELLRLHKQMIQDILTQQTTKVDEIVG